MSILEFQQLIIIVIQFAFLFGILFALLIAFFGNNR